MTPLVAPLAAIVLYGGLYLLRRSDTRLGQRIRNSDHFAWEMAMEKAQEERHAVETQRCRYMARWMWLQELDQTDRKIQELRAAEPSLLAKTTP